FVAREPVARESLGENGSLVPGEYQGAGPGRASERTQRYRISTFVPPPSPTRMKPSSQSEPGTCAEGWRSSASLSRFIASQLDRSSPVWTASCTSAGRRALTSVKVAVPRQSVHDSAAAEGEVEPSSRAMARASEAGVGTCGQSVASMAHLSEHDRMTVGI